MRRRTILATVGALFSAGCSEIVPPPQTTVTDGAPGSATDETATGTVPTDTLQTTDGSEPTTDQHTDTATDTPSESEREVAGAIETARGHLAESLSGYLAFAETSEPTLLDVTAATDVSVSNVTSPASDARQVLNGAPSYVDEDVERLSGVADFLTTAIRCQSNLEGTYSKFEFVHGRLYAEQFATLPDQLSQLRDRRDTAESHLETLRSETDRADMQAFDALSEDDYDRKVEQLQREVTAFGTLANTVETIADGLEAFIDGNDEFTDEDYDSAAELYSTATRTFGTANDTLNALDTPESLASAVSELRSVTNALATGAHDLADAASAADEYEWDTHDQEFESAVSQLRTSEVAVERIDSVGEIIAHYEQEF
ncbi:hypothetical protein [Halorientalis salina]|uniref:hypothetical protein n=1 Tax=Halorientalis salina TaxID=2932266 RepID=UPI0010AC210B|nr:hypothetical protein [Halorientalis salina]